MRGGEGITFNTRAEDLHHVWIPLTMKMTISKTQGLEICNWPEAEEVRRWELEQLGGSAGNVLVVSECGSL